ncbi:MAG: AMP-binding protein [Bacteroidia bacterium]|nr:AMP-binding protein [Bacteroidia bacterium]
MNYEEFCRLWEDPSILSFGMETSGSTGEPKTIKLEKKWLIYSAQQTQKALNIKREKILCCLPVNKVSGFMMMVRAKVLNLEFQYEEPSSNPMQNLDAEHNCTFVSLVPLQLKTILEDNISCRKLNRFSHILIGGGDIDRSIEHKLQGIKPMCFHTYGMTETYSHIALRKLNGKDRQRRFYPLPEVEISLNDKGCLQVCTVYAKNLNTNDLAEIFADNSFEILGRADFAINTGGIKIIPEIVEKQIAETHLLTNKFAVSSQSDRLLGEKLILVVEGKLQDTKPILTKLKTLLPQYHCPHKIVFVDALPMTETGKIRRVILRDMVSHTS